MLPPAPMKAKDLTGLVQWDQDLGQFAQLAPWLNDAWVAEPKLDGCRAMLHLRDGRSSFGNNRTGSFPFWGKISVPGMAGTILDGEFMAPPEADGHTAPHARTVGWFNSGPRRARDYEICYGRPIFAVFDIVALAGQDCTGNSYAERRAALETVVGAILAAYPDCGIVLVEQMPATAEVIAEVIQAGGEGVILKSLAGTYQPSVRGSRSGYWAKVKAVGTLDLVLTGGWKPGKNGREGTVGSVEVAVTGPGGTLVPVGSVAVKPELVGEVTPRNVAGLRGRVWEVAASARTAPQPEVADHALGRLRHPRFVRVRPDKAGADCLPDQLDILHEAV